jgi:hypothetical protein
MTSPMCRSMAVWSGPPLCQALAQNGCVARQLPCRARRVRRTRAWELVPTSFFFFDACRISMFTLAGVVRFRACRPPRMASLSVVASTSTVARLTAGGGVFVDFARTSRMVVAPARSIKRPAHETRYMS